MNAQTVAYVHATTTNRIAIGASAVDVFCAMSFFFQTHHVDVDFSEGYSIKDHVGTVVIHGFCSAVDRVEKRDFKNQKIFGNLATVKRFQTAKTFDWQEILIFCTKNQNPRASTGVLGVHLEWSFVFHYY